MDLIKRFLTYVSFDTTSDEESETTPSTEKQLKLGAYLRSEMETVGLKEVSTAFCLRRRAMKRSRRSASSRTWILRRPCPERISSPVSSVTRAETSG